MARMPLLYLPSYQHKLNPVDKIWWAMKGAIASNRLYGNLELLIEKAHEFFDQQTSDRFKQLTRSKYLENFCYST